MKPPRVAKAAIVYTLVICLTILATLVFRRIVVDGIHVAESHGMPLIYTSMTLDGRELRNARCDRVIGYRLCDEPMLSENSHGFSQASFAPPQPLRDLFRNLERRPESGDSHNELTTDARRL